jgi:17beta-estradiol 17-dehydrogenase / very-long-chain 3-oxoacyl-CoA reductase
LWAIQKKKQKKKATEADYGRGWCLISTFCGVHVPFAVKAAIAGKEVRVLVNNVGISYPFPEYLHLQTSETLDNLLTVNMESMIEMTRIVVPGMVALFQQSRARSLVYNVGSFSHLGAPLLGAYAGSKGFVHSLSESLRADYEPLGVDVVHFHPLFIATKLAKV